MSNIKSRLMAGALWLSLARGLTSAVNAVTTIVLARLLLPADFGLAAIATATIAILMAVTQLSLGSALIAKASFHLDHVHSVWTLNAIRSAIILVAFLVAAEPLAKLYGDDRLTVVLMVAGLTGAITGLNNPWVDLKAKELSFKQKFYVETCQRVVSPVASIILAIILKSYWALILGALFASISTAILSYALVPYGPRFRLLEVRQLFNFSIWLSLSEGLRMLNWRFDQLVIGYFLPKAQLGIYVIADNIAAIPVRESIQPLAQTLFPGFAQLRDNPAAIARGYCLAQSTIAICAFPVSMGLALIASPFVNAAMGAKWLAAVPIIQIIAIGLGVQTLAVPLQGLAMARSETRVLFWRDLRGFSIRIPLILIGYYLGGLMGIVYARVLSNVISTVLNLNLATRMIGVSVTKQLFNQWRTVLATLVMVFGVMALNGAIGAGERFSDIAQLALTIPTGALLYIGSLFLLWSLAGRPQGAEAEIARLLGRVMGRLLRPRSA